VEILVSLFIVILSCCSGGVHAVGVLSLGEISGVTSSDSLVVLSVGCGVLVPSLFLVECGFLVFMSSGVLVIGSLQ